jgi:hypothetical protein
MHSVGEIHALSDIDDEFLDLLSMLTAIVPVSCRAGAWEQAWFALHRRYRLRVNREMNTVGCFSARSISLLLTGTRAETGCNHVSFRTCPMAFGEAYERVRAPHRAEKAVASSVFPIKARPG